MAIGSKDLVPDSLRGFDDERLLEELRKAKEELFNLRFQSATGQLENHGRLRACWRRCAGPGGGFSPPVPSRPRASWRTRGGCAPSDVTSPGSTRSCASASSESPPARRSDG